MNINLLIYNPGLDKKPININNIDEQSFDEITSQIIKKKQQNLFSCDDSSFVLNYNTIITKKLINYIKDKSIDVCILQELCDDNIDAYKFNKYIASHYRYDD